MGIFWLILAVLLGLALVPWNMSLQGLFWWKPEGKVSQIGWQGEVRYLFWKQKNGVQQTVGDREWLDGTWEEKWWVRAGGVSKFRRIGRMLQWTKRYLPRCKGKELLWETQVGTGNAAWTALLCGILWGLKENVLLWVEPWVKRGGVPKLQVEPSYQTVGLKMQGKCIIHVSLVHIMIMFGFYLLANNKRKSEK